jgi:hypothetical protein
MEYFLQQALKAFERRQDVEWPGAGEVMYPNR